MTVWLLWRPYLETLLGAADPACGWWQGICWPEFNSAVVLICSAHLCLSFRVIVITDYIQFMVRYDYHGRSSCLWHSVHLPFRSHPACCACFRVCYPTVVWPRCSGSIYSAVYAPESLQFSARHLFHNLPCAPTDQSKAYENPHL